MHIVYSQNEYMNAKIEMNGKQGVLKLEKWNIEIFIENLIFYSFIYATWWCSSLILIKNEMIDMIYKMIDMINEMINMNNEMMIKNEMIDSEL